MKKNAKFLFLVMAISVCFTLFAACDKKTECETNGHTWVNGVCTVCKEEYPLVDYVAQCTLNENSPTAKYSSVNLANFIHLYIDGDTTHFNVPKTSAHPEGVLKARYLAVNTPESTGQVEPYGKVASNYTHETLQAAIDNGGAVLVEADEDDGEWHNDSYGRTTAWVWYKPNADAEWRNLNLELLQKGLGYGSSVSENRYGEVCLNALNQAMDAKLIVHSGEKDELYYYGDAVEITLKELRTNFESYESIKVAFQGYVSESYPSSGGVNAYVQSYDQEDGIYYGMAIFYNGSIGKIKQALTVGNYVRVVGTATNFNGSWQVSGLSYNIVDPDDPNNTKIVIDDDPGEYTYQPMEMTIEQFNATLEDVEVWDSEKKENVTMDFPTYKLLVGTAIKLTNLYVYDVYTTASGTSAGAITLYCRDANNPSKTITVRTEVISKWDDDAQKNVTVLENEFLDHYITVWGIVDWYNYNDNNTYQVRVARYDNFTAISESPLA